MANIVSVDLTVDGHTTHYDVDASPDILPVEMGGTGATTAEGARANLGMAAAVHTHTCADITDFTEAATAAIQAAGL